MRYLIKRHSTEIIGSLLCLSLGILSGYSVKAGDSMWYANLIKPSFNPPSWLFAPVWTVLYLMMGAALGKVWNGRAQNPWLFITFIIQFISNLSWSPLFFYFQRIDLALYNICLLWFSLVIFMALAWNKRSIFFLFLPYMLWVSFAAILNLNLYQMNII